MRPYCGFEQRVWHVADSICISDCLRCKSVSEFLPAMVGILISALVLCGLPLVGSDSLAGVYDSYSKALDSEFIMKYSDASGSEAGRSLRWRLRDQDDFVPFMDMSYNNTNDEVGFGIKAPGTLFDNTHFEYTILPQFTPRLVFTDSDTRRAWGGYLEWASVSGRTRLHGGRENYASKLSNAEDNLWLGYVEEDFSSYVFGSTIVDNQLKLLAGYSESDTGGSTVSGAVFLKAEQFASGLRVTDGDYLGVISFLTDNYGFRTWPTARLMVNVLNGSAGTDRVVVDGMIVLSRFSRVDAGFTYGAVKGSFYNTLGSLAPNRTFESPGVVTDPYQLGRIVLSVNSSWVDDNNKRNTLGIYLSRFSRIGIVRGAHVGFIRTEDEVAPTLWTFQMGVDGLRFLPSGALPAGTDEVAKIIVDLTADDDYLNDEGGFHRVDLKIEYDF